MFNLLAYWFSRELRKQIEETEMEKYNATESCCQKTTQFVPFDEMLHEGQNNKDKGSENFDDLPEDFADIDDFHD